MSSKLEIILSHAVPYDDRDWPTIAQAAETAGVAPRTVRAWCTKGYLRRYRVRNGYHVRVSRAELETFLLARAQRFDA